MNVLTQNQDSGKETRSGRLGTWGPAVNWDMGARGKLGQGEHHSTDPRTAENAKKLAMGTRKAENHPRIRKCYSALLVNQNPIFFVQRIHLFRKDEIAIFNDARGRLNSPE